MVHLSTPLPRSEGASLTSQPYDNPLGLVQVHHMPHHNNRPCGPLNLILQHLLNMLRCYILALIHRQTPSQKSQPQLAIAIHDRVVYPLQNHMGEFVGFTGHQLLYGLYQASKAIVAHKVRLLRRFNDKAILMLDGDGAGQKAMLAHLKVLLQAGMYVDIVVLPDGQDPDEFIVGHLRDHADASRESLLAAFSEYQRDWLTHCCASLAHCDAKTLRTRQSIIFELLAAIPDRVRQATATKKSSSMMDLSLDVILGALPALSPKHAETPQPLIRVEQSTISQREKAEKDIIRHLVLYGTYRQDVHHADSALVHWGYHTLQDDGIHFTNQILQRMMNTLYTAHQHWLSSATQCEDTCCTPYVLVPALQGSDDKHIATCTTRIYDQQMVQELTYGEDAQPSTQEILSSMQQFVQALKKGIAQDRMAALTKEAAELLAAEVVDEKRYREVMEEMRRGLL